MSYGQHGRGGWLLARETFSAEFAYINSPSTTPAKKSPSRDTINDFARPVNSTTKILRIPNPISSSSPSPPQTQMCMAKIIHFPFVLSTIRIIFFVKISVSLSGNCSTRSSYIYCLDSGLTSTWYNNNSVIMNGWQMRVFLVNRNSNNGVDYYSGFYCNRTCDSYLFSVVAVGGDNHRVLWTANGDRPVRGNATLQLTRGGLVLRDSDGGEVWSSSRNAAVGNSSGSIAGMNLNQTGNLVLFNNRSTILWESPASRITFVPSNVPHVLPTPPLPSGPPDLAPPGPNISIPTPPPKKHRKISAAIIAGSIIGALIIVVLLLILVHKFLMRIRAEREEEDVEDLLKRVHGMPVRFPYDDLCLATEDFKERLGSGGFGSVFKGVLADGTSVAVKRLDKLGQGMREFLAEVETIGSLHHFNLVRLIGFCAEKSCRLLVYEYMSNGSLDKWIFNKDQKHYLDWQTRKKIILDIAKGLAYLHEDCRQTILHLDIKPQNILLDRNFNAKVSDFGLSTLMNRDESQVLTTMRGTPGYLAPEWHEMRITVKVDVYSFGIVLLEVVTARRNFDHSRSESSLHLLELLQKKAQQDRLIDIVENLDEDMKNHREEATRMIRIGAWCLQDDPRKRPLMSTVVKVLEGVMEVDSNIIYKFSHVLTCPNVVFGDHVSSAAPVASVLSHPR